jgi:hypothetical protein
MWDCSIFLGRLAVQSSDRGRERERERERGAGRDTDTDRGFLRLSNTNSITKQDREGVLVIGEGRSMEDCSR